MNHLWDNDITVDTRPYIMEIQSYLRTIQQARYGSTTVPMDGFFGEDTTNGVRQFQEVEGLPSTGIVNRETWDAIYIVHRDIQQQQAPPKTIQGLRQPLLQPGDEGDAVVFLNVMLNTPGTVYTTDTETAVREIQKISFLPITGITDKDTWDAITTLYNIRGAM